MAQPIASLPVRLPRNLHGITKQLPLSMHVLQGKMFGHLMDTRRSGHPGATHPINQYVFMNKTLGSRHDLCGQVTNGCNHAVVAVITVMLFPYLYHTHFASYQLSCIRQYSTCLIVVGLIYCYCAATCTGCLANSACNHKKKTIVIVHKEIWISLTSGIFPR